MSYPGHDRSLNVTLDDGLALELRPATRDDKQLVAKGIREMSGTSRYLRFFSGFNEAPESVLDLLVDIDGKNHIAWCAIEYEGDEIHPVAAVHAVRDRDEPDVAELAVAVVDQFHGHGISRMLMALAIKDCITAGYKSCSAHILAENTPSLRLFKSFGSQWVSADGPDTLYMVDPAVALENLRLQHLPQAVIDAL